MSPQAINRPISIFISYAPEDENFRIALEKHMTVMRRNEGVIVTHMGNALGGDSVEEKRQEYMNAASIILLLISPDFMSSDLYDNELRPALIRSDQKLSSVIPIIIRNTASWEEDQLFGKLQWLPKEKTPVTAWSDRDSAITSIVKDIHLAVKRLKNPTK